MDYALPMLFLSIRMYRMCRSSFMWLGHSPIAPLSSLGPSDHFINGPTDYYNIIRRLVHRSEHQDSRSPWSVINMHIILILCQLGDKLTFKAVLCSSYQNTHSSLYFFTLRKSYSLPFILYLSIPAIMDAKA